MSYLKRQRAWDFDRPTRRFALNIDSPQAQGLVGWWPFIERDTILHDWSGQQHDMTPSGSPTPIVDPRFGFVTKFASGSSQYFHNDNAVLSAVPITLCSWFWVDDTAASYAPLGLDTISGSARFQIVALSGAGALRAQVNDTSNSSVQASTSVGTRANDWMHGVAVFSGTSDRRAFLDGGNKGTDATAQGTTTGINQTIIGARYSAGTLGAFLNGRIADNRIYNKALTDEEVFALYNPGTRWELYYILGRKSWVFLKPTIAPFTAAGDSTATFNTTSDAAFTAAGDSSAAFHNFAEGTFTAAGDSTGAFKGVTPAAFTAAGDSSAAFVYSELDWSQIDGTLNGSPFTWLQDSMRITPGRNASPWVCVFETDDPEPEIGSVVRVSSHGAGGEVIFEGFVIEVTNLLIEANDDSGDRFVRHNVTCNDYSWLLAHCPATSRRLTNVSPSSAIATIISESGAGVTVGTINLSGSLIPEITFDGDTAMGAISKLVERCHGICRVDFNKVFTAFTADTEHPPEALDMDHSSAMDIAVTKRVDQHVNRVEAEGGGAQALYDVNAGESLVPLSPQVDDTTGVDGAAEWFFADSTKEIKSNHQRLSFSGVFPASASVGFTPSINAINDPNGTLVPGQFYTYDFTVTSDRGESVSRGRGTIAIGGGQNAIQVQLLNALQPFVGVLIGSTQIFGTITGFKVYISSSTGTDTFEFGSLSMYEDTTLVLTSDPTGGTLMPTRDGTQFYYLSGVDAPDAIAAGDAVNVLAVAEDGASQAAFAARFAGASGIVTQSLSDGRYTYDEALQVANAELSRRGRIIQPSLKFTCYDRRAITGKQLHVDRPDLGLENTDMVIQQSSMDVLRGDPGDGTGNLPPKVTVSEAVIGDDPSNFTLDLVVKKLMHPTSLPPAGSASRPTTNPRGGRAPTSSTWVLRDTP